MGGWRRVAGAAISAAALGVAARERRVRRLGRLLDDERARAGALSGRLREVSTLLEVGKAVSRLLDLGDVLRTILVSAVDLLGGEEGSIMLVEGSDLVVAHSVTERADLVEGARVAIGEGIAGWVAGNREPLLMIAGLSAVGTFREPVPTERPIHSAVSVPLMGQEEVLGVLNVNLLTPGREFTEDDLRVAGLFAEHTAIAIRNARAYEKQRGTAERLTELDRMKSEFVATVSHELRTPLTAIIGSAKTIRRRGSVLTEGQHGELMEMIERQGERLLRMVEDVLSASRIEMGAPTLRREAVELVAVAAGVVEGFRAAAADSPVVLDAPERLVAYGDPVAIEQILTNLIDNAIKYSAAGSPVEVVLAEEPGLVRITVADHGHGIPAQAMPTIFERFRQLDQSTTRPAHGVGLGLYIVRNLVEAAGGRIEVSSRENEGSTFTVVLPRRREA